MDAANKAVLAPITVITPAETGANSIIGDMRQIKKTPAVTIVAA